MKTMLITGASKGIGAACADYFKDKYKVITTARTGNVTVHGDLKDLKFLEHLVSTYDIDVLINSAGVYKTGFIEEFAVNLIAPGYLTLAFYHKMDKGHIINICSTAANSSGWQDMEYEQVIYNSSKAALKRVTNILQNSKKKPVKVTSLEPAQINTTLGGRPLKDIPESEYMRQTMPLVLMKPRYIAEVIGWILTQPDPVIISNIEIQNLRVVSK